MTTRTYDTNGNELNCRHTDGTGYDYTYDTNGNELSRRYITKEN